MFDALKADLQKFVAHVDSYVDKSEAKFMSLKDEIFAKVDAIETAIELRLAKFDDVASKMDAVEAMIESRLAAVEQQIEAAASEPLVAIEALGEKIEKIAYRPHDPAAAESAEPLPVSGVRVYRDPVPSTRDIGISAVTRALDPLPPFSPAAPTRIDVLKAEVGLPSSSTSG